MRAIFLATTAAIALSSAARCSRRDFGMPLRVGRSWRKADLHDLYCAVECCSSGVFPL